MLKSYTVHDSLFGSMTSDTCRVFHDRAEMRRYLADLLGDYRALGYRLANKSGRRALVIFRLTHETRETRNIEVYETVASYFAEEDAHV